MLGCCWAVRGTYSRTPPAPFTIQAVNHSRHDVEVTHFAFFPADEEPEDEIYARWFGGYGLPQRLAPHGGFFEIQVPIFHVIEMLGPQPFEKPAGAWVKLSTDRLFRSTPFKSRVVDPSKFQKGYEPEP